MGLSGPGVFIIIWNGTLPGRGGRRGPWLSQITGAKGQQSSSGKKEKDRQRQQKIPADVEFEGIQREQAYF